MTNTIQEWKGNTYSFQFTDPRKPVRTFRSRRPSHFIFEIQNYSELLKSMLAANMIFFETPEFSVGNEKWTMCIYPNGKGVQGKNYVSLYLRRQKNGGRSKEASVSMKFFILEQNTDEYLVIEDLGEKNFDVRGKEWGIPQALEINHFENEDNGFLVDNKKTCTFGAEIYVTSSEPSFSQLALVKSISRRVFELVIKITPQQDYYESTTFTTVLDGESYSWKLRLYLDGSGEGSDSHVSLYLILVDANNKLTNGRKMLANFQFYLKNKRNGSYSYTTPAALEWFHNSKDTSGYPSFIERGEFFDSSTGYDFRQAVDVKVEFNSIFILNDADG